MILGAPRTTWASAVCPNSTFRQILRSPTRAVSYNQQISLILFRINAHKRAALPTGTNLYTHAVLLTDRERRLSGGSYTTEGGAMRASMIHAGGEALLGTKRPKPHKIW